MCLSVNLNYHKEKKNKPIPLVAKQSILVYKVLERDDNKHYGTPFVRIPINFDDEYGMFFYKTTRFGITKTCLFLSNGIEYGVNYKINRGIHSYANVDGAEEAQYFIDEITKIKGNGVGTIHKAIIPKGSKFYIGKDADIVSSNLVIFKNKTKYNKNKKYFGDTPIEFSEYLKKFGTEFDSK